jgi:hypothetical protein
MQLFIKQTRVRHVGAADSVLPVYSMNSLVSWNVGVIGWMGTLSFLNAVLELFLIFFFYFSWSISQWVIFTWTFVAARTYCMMQCIRYAVWVIIVWLLPSHNYVLGAQKQVSCPGAGSLISADVDTYIHEMALEESATKLICRSRHYLEL